MRGNPTLVFQTAGQIETRFPAGNRDVNRKHRGQNMSIRFSPHFMPCNLHNLLLVREPCLNKIGLFFDSVRRQWDRGVWRALSEGSGRLVVCSLGVTRLQAVEGPAKE